MLHVLSGLMEKGRNRAKRKKRARKKIIEVALRIWVLKINPIFLSAKNIGLDKEHGKTVL